ncbi:rho GTPase-activating protein 17-like [Watersipora subatra]|uniref:rho GTPase-activating protein 17-like n=1 Tax=Watersipora subatra TaxID=2589382 RepID=UPI00355C05F3
MSKIDLGIKKKVFRMKELAAQGIGKAEKTEVLSEDLQNAEKKVEVLRLVIQNLIKRLTASLQAHNIQDTDKRAKKMPVVLVANSMKENSEHLGEGLLKEVFIECSRGLELIGYEQQSYELILERSTLVYFQQLLEVDIPAIKKSKQTLSKLTLDMDATRSRQQAASKESSSHPSAHNQTKTDTLINDLEDAEVKVAACKDQYATMMLTFLSKESEICLKIVEWMDAQHAFYRKSVQQLDDLLPDLKYMIDQNTSRPVYGYPLEEHLQATGKEVATVIETCVSILYHNGMEEEGLFRVAGSNSKLKKLKAAFDAGNLVDMDDYYSDYHVVAGALKQYIRELPEPLLTFHLYKEFIDCVAIKDRSTRLQELWRVVDKLPPANLVNVRYLIKFLWKLSEKQAVNKMTPANIAIVFGPNLLWPEVDDGMPDVVLSTMHNQVVETLVQHHDYFFPQDVTFADVSSVLSHQNSVEKLPTSQNKEESSSGISKGKPTVNASSLSASQLSLTSTDSGNSSHTAHSPYNHRKNKKLAPAPPPFINHASKEAAAIKPDRPEGKPDRPEDKPDRLEGKPDRPEGKPDRPEGKPDRPEGKPDRPEGKPDRPEGKPDRSDAKPDRNASVKKPDGPPPGPPPSLTSPGSRSATRRSSESPSASSSTSKAPCRPNNPPPPTPSSDTTPTASLNPFLDDTVKSDSSVSLERSISVSPSAHVKTHVRNISADVPGNVVTEVRGHSRTKSHDLKLRQPPPIPQRTHSVLSPKPPSEHKSSLETTPEGDLPTNDSSKTTLINMDTPSGSNLQQRKDSIKETDLLKDNNEHLHHRNSVTDHTAL